MARRNRRWFNERDDIWYAIQDNDEEWIKQQDEKMNKYTKVLEGFLNDNAEGVTKNAKAPRFRSSASGKSAIVTTQDIPAGSVITFSAWTGKGNYGPYIKLSGQIVSPDQQQNYAPQPQQNYAPQPQQNYAPQNQQPEPEDTDPFVDDIPF